MSFAQCCLCYTLCLQKVSHSKHFAIASENLHRFR